MMDEIFNQVRRIFNDDGRSNKDFTAEEIKLKVALDEVREATAQFIRAAASLTDTINAKLNS